MIYIEKDLEKFRAEIEYAVGVIIDHSEVSKDIDFYYTNELPDSNKKFVHIKPSRSIFSEKYGKEESLPREIANIEMDGEFFPVIYFDKKPYIKKNQNFFSTSIDIVETFFFFLTRYEERVIRKRDKLGRFPDEESLIIKFKLNFTPVLDIYSKLIMKWMNKGGIKTIAPQSFFLLTHDIDRLKTRVSFRHAAKEMVHGNFRPINFYIKDRKSDILYSLSDISRIESKFKVGSVSFFMARKGNLLRPDSDYDIKDYKIREEITNFIKNANVKFGLHPSLQTFGNIELLKKEKEKAEAVLGNISFSRKHYLRYSMDFTFKNLSELGFKYDSSIGYVNHVGYKCGTAKPFLIFDPVKKYTLNITEIPLIVMDQALIRSSQKKVDVAVEFLEKLINNTLKYGGVFTILWHNHMVMHNFLNEEFDGFYNKIVEMLIESKLADFSKNL